jgi:Tol biopolymer transport system component
MTTRYLTAALVVAAMLPATASASVGKLVYARELPKGFQLFTSRADGTGERQITHLKGQPQHPDWSPDGQRIVFEYNYPNDKGCSIAFVDADGENFTNLGRAPDTCDFQPSYRPDGKRIVYTHYDDHANTETLTVAKLDGSDKRELTTRLKLGSVDANYSPNGRLITFVHIKKDEALQALFSIRADGSHLRRLTPYKWAIAVKHGWSPNGRRIIVTRQRDVSGRPALALLLRPDGSLVRRLARNAYVGGFSPNGKRVVMRIERKEGTEGRLVTMDPRGGHRRAINAWSKLRPRFIDWI